MAFELKNVVPWGRNLDEYIDMFNLSDLELRKNIIGFGDGPASFNYEMKQLSRKVVSIDPIYQFRKSYLQKRINETKDMVIQQTRDNMHNFVWKNIGSIEELEKIRMQSMNLFLEDFETGKSEGRYIARELPMQTGFSNNQFDLGLSSHFLLLYSQLGIDFHIQSITEMLRCCKEIRIFPILNLNAEKSEVLDEIIALFKQSYYVRVIKVKYEFQKDGNEMLLVSKMNKL